MNEVSIPDVKGEELFKFLKENKNILIAQKKYNVKRADPFHVTGSFVNNKGEVVKSAAPVSLDENVLKNSTVINTTNWLDSHGDVHIPGLWKKSLGENKGLYLLQEHSMTFKGIITDEVEAFTKTMTWKELGLEAPGETQALIFNNTIYKDRNPFMFDQYAKGRVKNHSVGMRYVDIQMAINSEDEYYKDELAIWNKYIDTIANKEEAEEKGYFFAVKQAKVIEGSAVPIGSNRITPTLENKESTAQTPPLGTFEPPHKTFDIKQILQNF